MFIFNKCMWQNVLIAVFLAFGLAACSTLPPNSNGAYVYTDTWWYDDYWYYQDHIYPSCCRYGDDFKESVERWWHTLAPDQQAEIKNKVENWKEGNNEPDISALKADFNSKWKALPIEKRQQITEKRQQIQAQMTGGRLSSEQKQAVKAQWQSRERPTLQRSQIHRQKAQHPTSLPSVRPTSLRKIRRGNLKR